MTIHLREGPGKLAPYSSLGRVARGFVVPRTSDQLLDGGCVAVGRRAGLLHELVAAHDAGGIAAGHLSGQQADLRDQQSERRA